MVSTRKKCVRKELVSAEKTEFPTFPFRNFYSLALVLSGELWHREFLFTIKYKLSECRIFIACEFLTYTFLLIYTCKTCLGAHIVASRSGIIPPKMIPDGKREVCVCGEATIRIEFKKHQY